MGPIRTTKEKADQPLAFVDTRWGWGVAFALPLLACGIFFFAQNWQSHESLAEFTSSLSQEKFFVGKTTPQEISDLIGQPSIRLQGEKGVERWVYVVRGASESLNGTITLNFAQGILTSKMVNITGSDSREPEAENRLNEGSTLGSFF